MSAIECPLCHRTDQVQRATAIVAGETQDSQGSSSTTGRSHIEGKSDYYAGTGSNRERVGDGRFSASGVNFSTTSINVTQQSRLAKKLVPPSPPIEPPTLTYPLDKALIAVIGVLAAVPALAFWWWLMGKINFDAVSFGENVWTFISCFFGAPLLGMGLWAIVFYVLGEVFEHLKYPPEKRQQLVQAHQAEVAEYDYQKHRWEIAMNRWNAMFYCRRCDVVYVPGDTIAPASPQDIIALAYAGAG